jgi:4-amino-4-deoxy-L-arabinose transferase-like glycosyltransferase
MLAWAGFTFLFFTLSKSKLPGYIMPAIPPMALLMANAAAATARASMRASRWPVLGTGLVLLVFGVVLHREVYKISAVGCVGAACAITPIWASAVLGGIVVGALTAARRLRIGLFAAVLTTLLLVAEVERFLPDVDAGISARNAALTVKRVWPEFAAENAATWQMNRSFVYQLNYYAGKEIRDWKPGDPRPMWLFVRKGKQQEAASFGFRCVDSVVLPAVIPCQNAGSLDRLGGGSTGNGLTGRQSR